ncbi:hypothetical protein DFJ74DRAFT_18091 [Hyaloraphidium curvatum]|nr:hypothetical protein DFJ74DRAFT_18091 [Hyaloraphidium curvatum]
MLDGMAALAPYEFPLLVLGPPPPSWPANVETVVHAPAAHPVSLALEPFGAGFVAHARRRRHNRTLSEDERMRAAIAVTAGEDVSLDEDEEETAALLASDPLEWKSQDHYAILGLSRLRWRATDDDIRKAYRRKVLKHHPDKKDDLSDDAFFKCVQKAWEVLSDPVKRQQWDSVDPTYDDAIPPAKLKPGADFFATYGPVFDRNGRWSKVQPVPELGGPDASKEEVDAFYEFWMGFESWRTFEAHDEEDPEKAESREEKRWIERGNRNARLKLKKEDNARLISLVENAMRADPRLQRFKDEERLAKAAKKLEKEEAAKRAAEEKQRAEEEARRAKEEKEREEKLQAEQEKKEREARKNRARKDRKAIRDHAKANAFYLPEDEQQQVALLEEAVRLDDLLESLEAEQLESYRTRQTDDSAGRERLREVYLEELERLRASREKEKKKQDQMRSEAEAQRESKEKSKGVPWSPKEIAVLIKAVKLFPGGTTSRWEKIASYVNTHGGEENEDEKSKKRRFRRPDECIRMSKELDEGQAVAMEQERERLQAVGSGMKKHEVDIKEAPTMRYEADEELEREAIRAKETVVRGNVAQQSEAAQPQAKLPPKAAPEKSAKDSVPASGKKPIVDPKEPAAASAAAEQAASPADNTWTPVQQAALEAALRQHPAAMYKDNPNERWDKIAPMVPGKGKKEIKARVKELAELIKKKKEGSA